MSMLGNRGGGDCQSQLGITIGHCKPDYEGMIEMEREKLNRYQKFFSAVDEFLDPGPCPDSMSMLIGELHQGIRYHKKAIEMIIQRQENDK